MRCIVEGVEIHVTEPEIAAGENEPSMLFLHGAGGDAAVWDEQAAYFQGRHPVYRLDLPGHGLSKGRGEEDISAYAKCVHAAIEEALPRRRWVVVGHSMGGAVALQLVLDHPGLLKGMVLVGTGAKLGVLPVIIKLLETDPDAFFSTIDLAAFCSNTPAEIKEISSRSIRRCPPQVTLKDFNACNRFDVRSRLHEISLPALIICGENDRLTPVKYSEFLHRNIPASTLVLIPEAAHMAMAEQPVLFNQSLENFLRSI
ncbi:MAG: alpha/beta hydrolase [Desulfobacteraceae bacterium]|nr:MAG: alpha/beta hydrolase [Desulfobacteraceae bacterium]